MGCRLKKKRKTSHSLSNPSKDTPSSGPKSPAFQHLAVKHANNKERKAPPVANRPQEMIEMAENGKMKSKWKVKSLGTLLDGLNCCNGDGDYGGGDGGAGGGGG